VGDWSKENNQSDGSCGLRNDPIKRYPSKEQTMVKTVAGLMQRGGVGVRLRVTMLTALLKGKNACKLDKPSP